MMRFSWTHNVEWGECDPAAIVFYPNIYRWFDKGAQDLMKAHGFGQAEMIEKFGIVGFPLIATHAEYKNPMRWGDEITVVSSIVKYSRKTFTVDHEVRHSNQLCVKGYEIRCWAMPDPKTDGKFCVIDLPPAFIHVLET